MPKNRQNNVKKTATTLNSKWLTNTLKSMGVAGGAAFQSLMPATTDIFKSASEVAKETATALRSSKTTQGNIQHAIKQSPVVKMGQDFFKNAIEDIKSGNLYNESRGVNSGDSEDMDFSFGDIDDFDDTGDVNIHNTYVQQGDDSATLKAVQRQTEYQVKSTKATVDTMVALSSASIMNTRELGSQMLSELSTINKNLSAMIEYQNSNMTKFIEASIGYYEQMTTKENKVGSSKSRVTQDDIFGVNGGLNLKQYKEFVKGNIKSLKEDSVAGSTISMILENKDAFVSNPIGMIMSGMMKSMVPQVMKASMTALDNSIKDFMPVILERIGDMGNSASGEFSSITQTLSKVFGIKTKRQKEFDFSKIEKGPVPYNGIANHTIVEIIPKYLRESNTYLREIAQAVTGKSNTEMSKGFTGFDWETGKFKKIEDIASSIYNQLSEEVISQFSRSNFGKKLSSDINTILTSKNASDNDRARYQTGIREFYERLERKQGQMNFNDLDEVSKLLSSMYASDDIKKAIQASLNNMMASNTNYFGSAHNAKIRASARRNSQMKYFEENAAETGLYQVSDILPDEYIDRKYGGTPVSVNGPVITVSRKGRRKKSKVKGNRGSKNQNNQVIVNFSNDSVEDLQALLTPDTLDEITGVNSAGNTFSANASKKMNSFAAVLNGIMSGNADAAWDSFMAGMKDKFSKAGSWLSDNFLTPMKKTLFGTKDENGYKHGGLFNGVNNRMKESFYSLRRMITGKGYTDAEGNVVADADENEMKNTVAGKLKGMLNWVKDGIQEKLFGKKDEDGNVEKEGAVGKVKNGLLKATSSFYEGLQGWKEALFGKSKKKDGESEEDAGKRTFEDLKKKAADIAPNAITGGISGGILGMLVGGPIGGALLGFGAGIASKSERFQNWLFGRKEGPNGERTGGVISKNVQDYVKKNGKYLAGGAVLGAVRGAIKGQSGMGLLGGLVGGPLAGAILGIGSSMILKSNMFQKFLYGDEQAGQTGLINNIKRVFSNFGKNVKGKVSGGKMAGMLGIGAGIGALTAGAISKAGLLGISLGPAGPIGGAILGLGAGILAQKDNFKTWLFGEVDEKTGVKKQGVLGKLGNTIKANFLVPMGNTFKAIGRDVKTFLKYDVFYKVANLVEPIGDILNSTVGAVARKISGTFGDIGNYIKENFLNGFINKVGNLLSPISSAASAVAKGMTAVGKAIVGAPIKFAYALTSPIAKGIAKTVGFATKAIFKTVDNILLKPINTLVIKPLGAITKGIFNIVSTPFKLLGKVAESINNKVQSFSDHVSKFFFKIGDDFKNVVKSGFNKFMNTKLMKHVTGFFSFIKNDLSNKIHEKLLEPIKEGVHKFIIDPISKGVKSLLGGFKKILLAPFKLIGNIFRAVTGREKKEKTGGGYFSRIWRMTGDPEYRSDMSSHIDTDENGYKYNTQSRKDLKRARFEELEYNRKKKVEDRLHQQNIKLIDKYSNHQFADDTDEARAYVERITGKKINWKGKALESEATKRAKAEAKRLQEEAKKNAEDRAFHGKTINIQENLERRVDDIFSFMTGQRIQRKFRSEKELNKAASKMAKKGYSREYIEKFIRDNRENIQAHADGTDYALPGLSIVGENGPEAVYRRNAKFGKLVGVNGPEVIRMHGGETVIPNARIAKYEDGTKKSDKFDHSNMSDNNIIKASDSKKLTIGERIIRGLLGIQKALRPSKSKNDSDTIDVDDLESDTPYIDQLRNGLGNFKNRLVNAIPGAGLVRGIFRGGRVLAGASMEAAGMLKNKISNGIDKITGKLAVDGEVAGDGSTGGMAEVTGLTGDALREKIAIQKEEDEDDAREDAKLRVLQNIQVGQEKHSNVWNSIFSKKGLITAGLLLLAPLAMKLFNKLPGLLDLIKNGINFIGDFLGNLIGSKKDQTYNKDGKSSGEVLSDIKDNATSGNILQLNEDGSASSLTSPIAALLARTGFNMFKGAYAAKHGLGITKRLPFLARLIPGAKTANRLANVEKLAGAGIYKAGKGAAAGANIVKNGAKSVLNKVSMIGASDWAKLGGGSAVRIAEDGTKQISATAWKGLTSGMNASEAALMAAQDGFEVVDDSSKGIAKLTEKWSNKRAAKAAEKATKKVASESVEAASKASSKGIKKVLEGWIDKFGNFVKEKVVKKFSGTKAGQAIGKIISKFKGGISKLSSKVLKKTGEKVTATAAAKGTGAAFTLGLSELAFATLGAINGVSGTAKLFKCKSEDVDGTMRIISGIFGALSGTTLGSIIDIILSVVSAAIGLDILNVLATTIYTTVVGEDSEKAQKLMNSQATLVNEYEDERDSKIEKQYETQKKAGLIDQNMSLEDFTAGINDGSVKVNYEGFDDYNTRVNASWSDKAISTVGKGLKAAGRGISNFFRGKEIKTDSNGNTYTKNSDGTWQVKSANGEDLGYVSADAIPEDAKSERKGGVAGVFKGIKSGLGNIWNSVKTGASNAVNKVKEVGAKIWGGVTNTVDKVKTGVSKFFKSHKEKAWYDTNGCYYVVDGNKYKYCNANGDVISDSITEDEFIQLQSSGSLTEGEITVDSGLKKTISNIGKNIKNVWSSFKTGISAGIDKVKSFAGNIFGKVSNTVGKIGTTVKNFLISRKQEAWYDTNGGYYVANGEGFNYYNATGDLIAEAIPADDVSVLMSSGSLTRGEITVDSGIKAGIKSIKEKVSNVWSSFKTGIGEAFDKTKEKIGSVFSGIKEKGLFGYIGGFFKKSTDKGWFLTDGSGYFKLEQDGKWNKYSMTHDLIQEDVPAENVQELISAGLATEDTIEKDSAAQKAIKDIKGAVKDAWSKAKDTVKNGWKRFTSWIGGGSGTGATIDDFSDDSEKDHTVTGGSGQGRKTNTIVRGGRGTDSFNGSTYYSQNDPRWANKSFVRSDGVNDGATMSNSGCGPTAMSMVLSDVKKGKVSPPDMARLAQVTGSRDETGTNWNFVDKASAIYGVDSEMTSNPSKNTILSSLDSGNPVLLSGVDNGSGSSPYTKAGHYIVAVGKDKNGNVLINDPRGTQYSGKISASKLSESTQASWTFDDDNPRRGARGLFRRGKRGGRGISASDLQIWIKIVEAVKEAIKVAACGYSQTSQLTVTIGGKTIKVRPDCSGLAMASLKYYGRLGDNTNLWSGSIKNDTNGVMSKTGFTRKPYRSTTLTTGDILVRNDGKKGHVCIFHSMDSDGKTKIVYNVGNNASSIESLSKDSTDYEYVWSPGPPGHTCIKRFNIEKIVIPEKFVVTKKNDKTYNSGKLNKNYGRTIYNPNTSDYSETKISNGFISSDSHASISSTNSGGINLISDIGSKLSTFASTMFNALLSGNTNVDWNAVFSDQEETNSTTDTTVSNSSSSSSVNSANANTKASIWKGLKNKGNLSPEIVAGIMGNFQDESGNDPKLIEGNHLRAYPGFDTVTASQEALDDYTKNILFRGYDDSHISINRNAYKHRGHYYPGSGLAQWTGVRGAKLREWAKSKGKDWWDLDTQLDFFFNGQGEFNSRTGLVRNLKKITNPEDAATYFLDHFEQTNGYSKTERGQKDNTDRRTAARNIYNQFKNGGYGQGVSLTHKNYKPSISGYGDGNDDMTIRTSINNDISRMKEAVRTSVSNSNSFDIKNIMNTIVALLSSISGDSKNLRLLKDISSSTAKTNTLFNNTPITNIYNSNGENTKTESIKTAKPSMNETLAKQIAFGQ